MAKKRKLRGRARNVDASRERERLAGVDALGLGEFLQIRIDQVGELQQNPRSLLRRRVRPRGKRTLRRVHRTIDIALVAVGHQRIRLSRRRLDVVEEGSADWFDELSVDKIQNPQHAIRKYTSAM